MVTRIVVVDEPELEAEQLLTPREVGAAFLVNARTVTRWANAGKLTPIFTPGGTRRYRASEVTALIEASRVRRMA